MSLWNWLHATDLRTWLGHGLQGVAITGIADITSLGLAAGIYATILHFGLREAPGVVQAVQQGNTSKLVDGLFDFFAPVAGIALWVLVKSLLA